MKLKPAGELNYQTLHSSWIFVSTWDGIALNTRHLVNETLCFQKGSSVLLIRLNVLDSNLLLFHVNTEKILNLSVNWINSGSASSFFFLFILQTSTNANHSPVWTEESVSTRWRTSPAFVPLPSLDRSARQVTRIVPDVDVAQTSYFLPFCLASGHVAFFQVGQAQGESCQTSLRAKRVFTAVNFKFKWAGSVTSLQCYTKCY